MGRLTISSGCSSFVLIDSIESFDKESISGKRLFHHDPAYLGVEALAQLGAMHVRYITDFKKHAFLLKINYFRKPEAVCLNGAWLNGVYDLKGKCVSQSNRAFVYALTATGVLNNAVSGEFMFATIDYDLNFKQDVLKRHYKQLFSCLKNDLKTV